jgi:hypothetical protein
MVDVVFILFASASGLLTDRDLNPRLGTKSTGNRLLLPLAQCHLVVYRPSKRSELAFVDATAISKKMSQVAAVAIPECVKRITEVS